MKALNFLSKLVMVRLRKKYLFATMEYETLLIIPYNELLRVSRILPIRSC